MATVENITDEDVARLQDMVAARKQLKKLGLSTKNINSVDAAKEALRSHIHRDRTGGLRKPDLGIVCITSAGSGIHFLTNNFLFLVVIC